MPRAALTVTEREGYRAIRLAAHIACCAILLLNGTTAKAQNVAQFVIWGDNAMRTEDFYGASRFYAEALQQEGGRMEIQWKHAEACRLSDQYPQAAEGYETVWRKDLGRSHPEALRWLGEMQLCSGRYDEAQKTWQKVKQKTKDKSGQTMLRADNALIGIAMAKEMMAHPEEVTIDHLPEPVNTYDSEFASRIGPDGRLYLTSLRGELNDNEEVIDSANYVARIYHSDPIGEQWATPRTTESIPANISTADPAWSLDSSLYLCSRCRTAEPCRIHIGNMNAGQQPLNGLGEAMSTQPMVALYHGKETLFFTSDREGGQGGLDIWAADLSGTTASNLRPLGPPVNTPGNESCPFYDVDQRKLYFSSDFLPGFGGYDNFMSADSGGTFTAPQNFKYPLNGPANDLYPTFDVKSMSGFLTSNRIGSLAKKGATCCNDIYRYSYLRLQQQHPPPKDTSSTIAEKHLTSLREKLPIRLYFHNDEPGPRSWDTLTALTYEETYRSYKGLLTDYHQAWGDNTEGKASIDAFFRDKVDFGFTQLNDFITLLERALTEGQRIELQVRGFASPLAKSEYNANLSLRRISSMVNYLGTVHGGALRPYLNSGALRIRKSPYGEDQSASGVSDLLEDLKGSVYSVGASLERRIEIEQVMLAPEAAVVPGSDPVTNVYNVLTNTITQDIGSLPTAEERDAVFLIRNTTAVPMTLMRAKPDCDCVSIELPTGPIPAGGAQRVKVHFNGRAPAGPLERGITVHTDGDPATLRLIVTGNITSRR